MFCNDIIAKVCKSILTNWIFIMLRKRIYYIYFFLFKSQSFDCVINIFFHKITFSMIYPRKNITLFFMHYFLSLFITSCYITDRLHNGSSVYFFCMIKKHFPWRFKYGHKIVYTVGRHLQLKIIKRNIPNVLIKLW